MARFLSACRAVPNLGHVAVDKFACLGNDLWRRWVEGACDDMLDGDEIR
jgi:hypothetical protein